MATLKSIRLRTAPHTDRDGHPSKTLKLTFDDGTQQQKIYISLGAVEAGRLAAALRPNGKDIDLTHGRSL